MSGCSAQSGGKSSTFTDPVSRLKSSVSNNVAYYKAEFVMLIFGKPVPWESVLKMERETQ